MFDVIFSVFVIVFSMLGSYLLYSVLRALDNRYEFELVKGKFSSVLLFLGCLALVVV